MKHIHLIGIGGSGLSAIARVLLERGYTVSGSDQVASTFFKAITAAGAKTFLGHAAEHITGADLVIRSSAISDDNPEVIAALAENIPVLKRAQFLDQLTKGKDTLAVAGSHGKTTTTAMLIWILDQLGTKPSFIAGGVVTQLDCNARAGAGRYFAIEADEYDNMFLGLSPQIAIVTNIEHDHPDCFPTAEQYRNAFKDFLQRVRPKGLALMCLDDPEARSLMDEFLDSNLHILGYGTTADADYRANEIIIEKGFPKFTLDFRNQKGQIKSLGTVTLRVPGRHNVLNASAALATVHQLGLSMAEAMEALHRFTGAGRRFEVLGRVNGTTIIDDYGHHPTEIAATLEAAHARYPEGRIWAVWQPHTYSRTAALEKAFIQALERANRVIVLKVFASREENSGYSAEKIANVIPNGKADYMEDFVAAANFLIANLAPKDVVIVFSAGNATELSQAVLEGLQQKRKKD
jgi:UDP-N-acetylmuramate--alanine ligase